MKECRSYRSSFPAAQLKQMPLEAEKDVVGLFDGSFFFFICLQKALYKNVQVFFELKSEAQKVSRKRSRSQRKRKGNRSKKENDRADTFLLKCVLVGVQLSSRYLLSSPRLLTVSLLFSQHDTIQDC